MFDPKQDLTALAIGSLLRREVQGRHEELIETIKANGTGQHKDVEDKHLLQNRLLAANGEELIAACSQCNRRFKFLADDTGKEAPCIYCQQPLRLVRWQDVPREPEPDILVKCPYCGDERTTSAIFGAALINCSYCSSTLDVARIGTKQTKEAVKRRQVQDFLMKEAEQEYNRRKKAKTKNIITALVVGVFIVILYVFLMPIIKREDSETILGCMAIGLVGFLFLITFFRAASEHIK